MIIATAPAEPKAMPDPNLRLVRSQIRALAAIKKNQGQPYGCHALAHDLNVSIPYAKDLLAHLKQSKIIERSNGKHVEGIGRSKYRLLVELDAAQEALLAHGANISRKRADKLRVLSTGADKVATCPNFAKAINSTLPNTHAALKALAKNGIVELVPDSNPSAYRLLIEV